MKVFYRAEQTAKKNNSHSPSAQKPALVVESWKTLYPDISVQGFEPISTALLYQIHDRKYVDGVLAGRRQNGFGNKLKEVADTLLYTTGSMVAATLHALRTGETSVSPTSGFHHACYDHGGGYCTFNGLVLAALEAYKAGARRVGIIDCDMHAGNGTKDIIERLRLHFIDHYSFGYDQTKPYSAALAGFEPVGRVETRSVLQWLSVFTVNVQDIMRGCDVVIYNAGMDVALEDPLGGVLSDAEIEQRDNIIFRAARQFGKPIAWSLAGGYQSPVDKVVALHNLTYKAALRWENL